MLRSLFICIVFAHGLIHLLGFIKAFEFAEIKELSLPISKPFGLMWLAAFLIFLVVTIFLILKSNYWWLVAFLAVLCSQILIINFWQDAKFGTIANVFILLMAIVGFGTWNFENTFQKDVKNALHRTNVMESEFITGNDLQHLPQPVQNYLNYVGVVGKPKIKNFKIEFEGEMRGKDQDWFRFTSQQFNFFDNPERLFFMKAKVKGLPAYGYHAYKNGEASMLIKLLSLFPVVDTKGREMDESETVTFFNDMCLFAPAKLIDKSIRWEEIDHSSVKAIFTNKSVSISAILYFNENGQLIDFVSDDRYDVSDMKKYRFSTPADHYKNINGHNLCTYGEAVWHYPEGNFVYGKFYLKEVAYNVSSDN